MSKDKTVPMVVFCDGGCGKNQRVRKRYIETPTWYVCNSYGPCFDALPNRDSRLIRVITFNAAGGFYGVQDRIATVEERESIERAKRILDDALAHRSFT